MAGWPPKKNTAFSFNFVIRDADGDPVASPAGMTALISQDNEGEIGIENLPFNVSSGSKLVGLTLTAGDMNADFIGVVISSTSTGAKDAFFEIFTDSQQIGDVLATSAVPTNFSSLDIETNGRMHVQTLVGVTPTIATTNQVLQVDVFSLDDDRSAGQNLSKSASTIVRGTATSTTLSTTQMSTNLTEETDDHLNGRIIIWTSGVLLAQATDISDYTGSTKTLTFTAVTESPSDGDTFVII
jgi:hypothetical protein